jgi:hypothetical protein
MIIDWQSAERMQCSRAERIQLVPLIDLVVQASEKARREGLLALEDDVRKYAFPLFKLGMHLVVDGTDPTLIDSILTSRILSENKSGKDLLEQMIIHDAVLSIQSGDNPRLLVLKCFALMGADATELQEQYLLEVSDKRDDKSVEDYLASDGAVDEFFAATRKILSFDDRAVQKILREMDTSELVMILEGSDSDVRKKVLRNMSRRAARLLVDERTHASPNQDMVNPHVERLFAIITMLEKAGEIVVPE